MGRFPSTFPENHNPTVGFVSIPCAEYEAMGLLESHVRKVVAGRSEPNRRVLSSLLESIQVSRSELSLA